MSWIEPNFAFQDVLSIHYGARQTGLVGVGLDEGLAPITTASDVQLKRRRAAIMEMAESSILDWSSGHDYEALILQLNRTRQQDPEVRSAAGPIYAPSQAESNGIVTRAATTGSR